MSTRVKVVKKSLADKNIVNMFNNMLGGEGDPEVIKEKEAELLKIIRLIGSILSGVGKADSPLHKAHPEWAEEVAAFADTLTPLSTRSYKELKNNRQIRTLVMVCTDLIVHSQKLQAGSLGTGTWVMDVPGMTFEPFTFSGLDLKRVWAADGCTDKTREYYLQIMSLMFQKCHRVYQIVTGPDVDPKKFSQVIIESINKVKTLPELNRCSTAFQKIADSVGMLEGKFDTYYKDMVASENPNTMIESFIIDVSNGQTMSPKLMQEFRTIIAFYKRQNGMKKQDPKFSALFKSLESNMDRIEQNVYAKPTPSHTERRAAHEQERELVEHKVEANLDTVESDDTSEDTSSSSSSSNYGGNLTAALGSLGIGNDDMPELEPIVQ